MAAQPRGSAAAAFLFNRLKHVCKISGIVTGTCHDLGAQDVGLGFVLAAIFEQVCAQPELCSLGDHITRIASNDGSENRPSNRTDLDFCAALFCSLGCSMTKRDMADLVSHYSSHLALG